MQRHAKKSDKYFSNMMTKVKHNKIVKEMKDLEEREHAAAVAIQKIHRGRMGRKQVEKPCARQRLRIIRTRCNRFSMPLLVPRCCR